MKIDQLPIERKDDSRPLAVFDIGRTLTREFLITPIIKSEEDAGLVPTGLFDESVAILARYKRGELEYEVAAHQLLVAHASGLRGKSYVDLEAHTRDYLRSHPEVFRAFGTRALRLLSTTHGTVAVTAEPAYMAQGVAEVLGIDATLSSEYGVREGVFIGEVTRSLAHRSEKRHAIGLLRPNFAFGDSAGDIDMLDHAHFAYCIAPDKELADEARERQWNIFDGDTNVDYLMATIKEDLRMLYSEHRE